MPQPAYTDPMSNTTCNASEEIAYFTPEETAENYQLVDAFTGAPLSDDELDDLLTGEFQDLVHQSLVSKHPNHIVVTSTDIEVWAERIDA
jgi:hypothetical protein